MFAVTGDAAWEEWILYVLEGVQKTAQDAVDRIQAIRKLQEAFGSRAAVISKGEANAEFQSGLCEQPYCRISTVMAKIDSGLKAALALT